METGENISASCGDRIVAEFTTKMPLASGEYSILAQVVQPIIAGESARFIDVVPCSYVFNVNARSNSKIWSLCYIHNGVKIWK